MQQVDDFEKKFLTRDEAARLLGLRPQTWPISLGKTRGRLTSGFLRAA
jgi:hypothetical protein